MNLLEDLKILLLNFNCVMISITNKMFVSLKNHLNYLKDSIFECFFRENNRHFFNNFFTTYNDEKFKLWRRKINYTAIKYIRNIFRQEKETKAIKDKILWDTTNLLEQEEEKNYYKPVRVSKFWSNNYIEYKTNSDRNKKLSIEEYLNKIRPYLEDM